jgi:outer membrane biosynthesis protein TonB
MKRNVCVSGFRSGAGLVLSYLGLAFVTACSQAPAFSEQALNEVEYQKAMGESDSSRREASGDAVARENDEGTLIMRTPVVDKNDANSAGQIDEVPTDLPDPVVVVVDPTPAPTPDPIVVVVNPTPTPTPDPIVVVVNPTPTPTPVPVPKPGNLHQHVVQQPEKGKVDILWVIDDSGSMGWAQSALAAKFESFASKLTEANIDFHLGLTTTNMCDPKGKLDEFCPKSVSTSSVAQRGNLVAVPNSTTKYLSSGQSSVVSAFKSMAMVGTNGSSLEQGLSAAKYAVMNSLPGKFNAGFLRTDARLSLIVLSDEEDDGVGMWGTDAYGNAFKDSFATPAFALDPVLATKFNFKNQHMTADRFVQDLNALKGAGEFQVNAITGIKDARGETTCGLNADREPYGPKEAGTNYIKAAGLTGGVVQNICSDWTRILSNIGQSTVELTTRIQLEKAPFPGTLEVSVDGTVWSTGYEFDAASNTVVFKVLPPYGAEVVVTYRDIVQ